MGYLEYTHRSKILGRNTKIAAFIPSLDQKGASLEDVYPADVVFPVLYLMHGGSHDSGSWFHTTMVETYAQEKQLMLVSCDLEASWCANTIYGDAFFDYVTKEVMLIAQRLFHASPLREDNFIAGFSMGGHCAMKIALRCPEKFSSCFAMSGAKDAVKMRKLAASMGITPGVKEDYTLGPIDEMYGKENDLLDLARELSEKEGLKPKLYTSCGTEDYGFSLCKEYADYLDQLGLDHHFYTVSGKHDMLCGDETVKLAIRKVFEINPPHKLI